MNTQATVKARHALSTEWDYTATFNIPLQNHCMAHDNSQVKNMVDELLSRYPIVSVSFRDTDPETDRQDKLQSTRQHMRTAKKRITQLFVTP